MGLIQQTREYPISALKTLLICLSFLTFGMTAAMTGPTLLDLQIQVNTTLEMITLVLPVRSFGNVLGCVGCGFLLQFVQVQWLLGGTFFILMIVFTAIAYCTTMVQLLIVMLLNGICYGSLLNCGNMFTLHLWGQEVGPFMQAVHFAFGLGAFFSPLIVEPFLIPRRHQPANGIQINQTSIVKASAEIDNPVVNSSSSSLNFLTSSYTQFMGHVDTLDTVDNSFDLSSLSRDQLRLTSAFYIMAAINCAVFALYLVVMLRYPDNPMHPSRQASMDRETALKKKKLEAKSSIHQQTEAGIVSIGRSCPSWMRYVLIGLAGIFIHAVYGVELSFGALLTPYVVHSDLHLSTSQASFLTSFYWACFAFLRLFAVLLVNYISSAQMLFLSLTVLGIGNLILLPWANTQIIALWIGTGFVGAGVCSIYASLYSFLEQHIMVTGQVTSILTISACLGEFVLPVFIGHYIDTHPMYYLYILFSYGSAALVIFTFCYLWARRIDAHCHPKS